MSPLGESPEYVWLFRPIVARRRSVKLEMTNSQTHVAQMCAHIIALNADEHLERFLVDLRTYELM